MTFEGHFLNSLFPGMNDLPPPFATQEPPIFDNKLPKLTVEDVEKLKKEVSELQEHLTLPDNSEVMNFFSSKSMQKTYTDNTDDRSPNSTQNLENAVEKIADTLKPAETPLMVLPHIKDGDRYILFLFCYAYKF